MVVDWFLQKNLEKDLMTAEISWTWASIRHERRETQEVTAEERENCCTALGSI